MKKTLLAAALLALSTTGWAQYTFDTALDAQPGECSTESTEGTGYIYWKYTATKDVVVTATDINNSYTAPDGFTYDSSTKLAHANMTSPMKAWNVSNGETIYFRMTAKLNKTVGFTLAETDYEVANGTSADAPAVIENGKTYFFGDCHTSGTQTIYANYTATQAGELDLTMLSKATSLTIDGTTITPSNKHYKQNVTAGQTYNIVITYSRAIVGTVNFTASESGGDTPTQGTLDTPFELVVGQNKVPAAAGKYYYTYTPATTGYFTITGDETLENGYVKIYNIKSGITYNSPSATSTVGSFNVSAEVQYSATQPYYVEVTKTVATDAEQTFNFQMKDYEPGEKSSNPKVIEVPSDNNIPAGFSKYYYKVTVPANTEKNLVVEATSTIASENTKVYVYPEGSYYYTGESGNGFVRYDVTATEEKSYIIYWNTSETEPVAFKVYYEDNKQGVSLDNPLEAVLGENTLVGTGTQYYTYTAASTGKLSVTAPTGSTVSFPLGTDVLYDGYYDAIVNGQTYSRECTAGSKYFIAIEKATEGEVFVVAEGVFEQGETMSDPIVVDSTTYDIDAAKAGNLWLSYTAPKAGTLTVKCDLPYNANDEIDYGLTTDDSLYPLLSSKKVDGKTVYYYENSAAVAKDNVMLVHLKLTSPAEGYKVTFSMGELGEGESWATAYELKYDTPLNIGTPSAKTPIWVKIVSDGTPVNIVCSDQATGSWYVGDEAAEADKATSSASFTADNAYDDGTVKGYQSIWNDTPAGNYYLKFTGSWDYDLTLTLLSETYTGIENVDAATLNAATVFTLGGQKVAEQTAGLNPGIYVVKQNGKTRKVLVK